jgi:hypothetical protein
VQLRDIAGEGDRKASSGSRRCTSRTRLREDADFLFRDATDWSVLRRGGGAVIDQNRDLHRAWADNCYGTRQFLIDNYVRFTRIHGTHPAGGISRPRRATAFLMLGDKTDIKKGTVTKQEAGIEGKSSSNFAPRIMGDGSKLAGPGAVWNGAALTRGLEFSAREKGVQFMLNRRMTEFPDSRAQFSGRNIGIKTSYTPRFAPTPARNWAGGTIATSTSAADRLHPRSGSMSAAAATAHSQFAACSTPQ